MGRWGGTPLGRRSWSTLDRRIRAPRRRVLRGKVSFSTRRPAARLPPSGGGGRRTDAPVAPPLRAAPRLCPGGGTRATDVGRVPAVVRPALGAELGRRRLHRFARVAGVGAPAGRRRGGHAAAPGCLPRRAVRVQSLLSRQPPLLERVLPRCRVHSRVGSLSHGTGDPGVAGVPPRTRGAPFPAASRLPPADDAEASGAGRVGTGTLPGAGRPPRSVRALLRRVSTGRRLCPFPCGRRTAADPLAPVAGAAARRRDPRNGLRRGRPSLSPVRPVDRRGAAATVGGRSAANRARTVS